MRSTLVAVALLIATAAAAHADVTLPSVFSDHMVLQRGQAVPVWGRGKPGERVTVELAGQKKATRVKTRGTWRVVFDALEAGGPHRLVVQASNRLTFEDVLVGEVWVCSGQSNMAWSVKGSADATAEIAAAAYPKIRLLTVPRRPMLLPRRDFRGSWTVCSPTTVPGFSAVAYYFGRRLHKELGVPIGLINTSYGGTPAEAWTDDKALRKERKLAPLLERWAKALKRDRGGKRGAALSAHRPSNLWNGMVAPLLPYAIRGAIWYQGESNAGRATQYHTLFPAMIRAWRTQWGQGAFPFHFVQLANFRARKEAPGESAWAELREAQRLTLAEVPNTGMAVIIDIGEAKDIHPKNKQDVGARLAAWALHHDYEQRVVPSGPLFRSAKPSGKAMVLSFDHAAGLETTDDGPLRGFAVADRSKRWVWGQARIQGERIIVTHPTGRKVKYVRYGWADNPDVNLVNAAGLPASPFRTDDLPLTTEGKS